MNISFTMPKHAAITIACAVAMLIMPCTHIIHAANTTTERPSIGIEKAKQIALTDADISEADFTYIKQKLDDDDKISVYEIDFYTNSYQYEYEINVATGNIHKKCMKMLPHKIKHFDNSQNSNSYISTDQARDIATEHANLSTSEVHFSKVQLEREHGMMVYEIEFYYDGLEYEYTIDASTGSILKYELE